MDSAGGDVGIDDRDDIEGNVESEMYVYDDRPFLERISPFDMFVDPDARNPKEMAWIAQRIWRPIQDVQVDGRYLPAARKKVSARGWSRWSNEDGDAREGEQPTKGAKSFCEVVEFYDIKRRTMCTFALDSDDAERRVRLPDQAAPDALRQGPALRDAAQLRGRRPLLPDR